MSSKDRKWIKPTILLCSYGFFTYIKPSEPYITPFLMGHHKNLTEEEVTNRVYPVWVYSYTAFLVPIFLLTDYLRYKPIIALQGVGYIGCWLLLVFSTGVPLMQLMQVSYGLATACEIGYYAYIYSVVEHEHYQKATSYVRTSTQLGLFIGSALSQILVTVAHVDYLFLNIISLATVSFGFLISWFLPLPERTLYFFRQHVKDEPQPGATSSQHDQSVSDGSQRMQEAVAVMNEDVQSEAPEEASVLLSPQPPVTRWKSVLFQMWHDLKHCYSSPQLLRWSGWWALSTCGWILVVNYIQNLWETILSSRGNEAHIYNGAVESAAQIFGAVAAFCVGYLKVDWKMWGEMFLGFGSVIECGLLLVMCFTSSIWVCYAAYVVFIALYNFVITISQFRIAVGLSTERFALVFGVNTFLAVVLSSLLTLVLVDEAGLGLDVNTQFIFYSAYFGLIAIVYLGHGVFHVYKQRTGTGNLPGSETVGTYEDQDLGISG